LRDTSCVNPILHK